MRLLRPLPSNGRCLQSHYLATAVVELIISRSLSSNRSTCHIALSFRLFVANSLRAYRHFLAFEECDRPRLRYPELVSHGDFFYLHSGVQTGSTQHVGHLLAYCTCPGWLWGWRIWWNEWQGKPNYSEKTCPGATLSTTYPTWPGPGLNPGRRGGKPATNRFSYGAAFSRWLLSNTFCCSLLKCARPERFPD
jgi:hypothetical protein